MTTLSDIRHERFATYMVEGLEHAKVLELSGYKVKPSGVASRISELLNEPDVIERIADLQSKAAIAAALTTGKLITMALDAYTKAMEIKQIGAAVAAIKEAGILSGKRIERQEVGLPGEFDALDDAELDRLLALEYERIRAIPVLELEADHGQEHGQDAVDGGLSNEIKGD